LNLNFDEYVFNSDFVIKNHHIDLVQVL